MMIAAVAGMAGDFAELKVKAGEVERHRDLPSQFQMATEALSLFSALALEWDKLDEPHRDLLRHLAHALADDRKIPWLRKQRAAVQFALLVMRHGVDEVARQAHAVVEAADRFRSIVMEAEERNNEKLQAAIAKAVNSALETPSTARLTVEQVGEWIRNLPY